MILTLSEKLKAMAIISGALAVSWMFFIRPHTFDWEFSKYDEGTVRTLMSNSNVLNPEINAVVELSNGRQVLVSVPIKSDVRRGDVIILSVESDVHNSRRRRYRYYSEVDKP